MWKYNAEKIKLSRMQEEKRHKSTVFRHPEKDVTNSWMLELN